MIKKAFLLFAVILLFLCSCKRESKRTIDLQGVTHFLPSKINITSLSQINDSSFFAGTENGIIYLIENDSIKRVFNTRNNTPIYKVDACFNKDTILNIGFRDRKGFQRWNANGYFDSLQKFSIYIKDSFSVYNFCKISEHSDDYIVASSNGLYRTHLPSDSLELLYPTIEILQNVDDYRVPIYNLIKYQKNRFLFSASKGLLRYDPLSNKIDTLFEISDLQHISAEKDSLYLLSSDSLYVFHDGSVVTKMAPPVKDAIAFYKIYNGYWFFSGQSLKILQGEKLRVYDNIIHIKSKSSRNLLTTTSDYIYFISEKGGGKIAPYNALLTRQAIRLSALDPVTKKVYFLNDENLIFRKNPGSDSAIIIGKIDPEQEFKRMLAYNERLYFVSSNAIKSFDKPSLFLFNNKLNTIFRKESKEDIKSVVISGGKLLIGTDIRLYSRDIELGITDTLLRENIESIYNTNINGNDISIVGSLTNAMHYVSNGKLTKSDNKKLWYVNYIKENDFDNLIIINDSSLIEVTDISIRKVCRDKGQIKLTTLLKGSSIVPWATAVLNDSLLFVSENDCCKVLNINNPTEKQSIFFVDRNSLVKNVILLISLFLIFIVVRLLIKTRKNTINVVAKQGEQQQLVKHLNHRINDLKALMSIFPYGTEQYEKISKLLSDSESYLKDRSGNYGEDFLDFISQSLSDLNREKGNIETYQNLINSKIEELRSCGVERDLDPCTDRYNVNELKKLENILNSEITALSQGNLSQLIESVEIQAAKLKKSITRESGIYYKNSIEALDRENPEELSLISKKNNRFLGVVDNYLSRLINLENEMATLYLLENVNEGIKNEISNLKGRLKEITVVDCGKAIEELEADIEKLKTTNLPDIGHVIDKLSPRIIELEEIDQTIIKEQIDMIISNCNDSFSTLRSLKNLTIQIEQAHILKKIAENKQPGQNTFDLDFREELKTINAFFELLLPEDKETIYKSLSIKKSETEHAKVFCIIIAVPDIQKEVLDKALMDKDCSSRRSEVKSRLKNNIDLLQNLKSQVVSCRIEKVIKTLPK